MAASNSNPSFIVEIGEEYPSPSHVYTPILVTVKLSGKDRYNAWKTQLLCLLTSHNMLGFINGKVARPKGNVHRKEAWMRSDSIVKSWILGTLSEEVTMHVLNRLTPKNPNEDFTAKDVWDEIKCIYGGESTQQAIASSSNSSFMVEFRKDKSKEEETNEEEREKIQRKETDKTEAEICPLKKYTLWEYKVLVGRMPNKEVSVTDKTEAHKKLYEFIVKQKMNLVDEVLEREKVFVTDIITKNGNTALHVAADTSKDSEFFEKMLKKTPENVKRLTYLKNSDGSTLLHIAATVGNIEAAKILMEKYPDMLIQRDNKGQTPLVVALSNMHSKVYWDLLALIDKRPLIDLYFKLIEDTVFTEKLLELTISYKDFYLARNFIWWRCRNLDSDIVLMAIAQNYPCELSFWERRAAEFEDTPIANVFIGLPFVKGRLQFRHEAFQVLLSVCKFIQLFISSSLHKDYYTNPVFEATRLDALDVVKVIVYHFPDAFGSESKDGHNIIQYAVINRSEKIYNLLYHMSEHRNVYKTIKDASGNNLLHLAARLAPSEKLNLISGAALQIQYELQWYKEVEGFVCPLNITEKNSFEETPKMVFTRTHKALVSEGEKWMRSTAESYTITAALITTIVFAAAITVPGGNTQDTGVPIFTNNPAFTIFAVSDAISLFTAVMSLLMFLSILTARFAEEDFLIKLPRKLIIGLVTLFISTTTMIIAFGAALFIVFGQNNRSLLIPIGAFTGLIITFFVVLQFPLVVDLMRTTYGSKRFGKRNATSKTCLQNYIRKITCRPIVKDKKEEKENMMEIDWYNVHGHSRYNFVNCDDIPFNI